MVVELPLGQVVGAATAVANFAVAAEGTAATESSASLTQMVSCSLERQFPL